MVAKPVHVAPKAVLKYDGMAMEHQKLKQNVAHVSAAANDRDSTTNPISNGNSSGGFYFAIVLCILGHSFKMFLTDKGS